LFLEFSRGQGLLVGSLLVVEGEEERIKVKAGEMLGSIIHGHGREVAGGFHLTRERSPWHDHFLVPVLRTVLEGALK
jgi:hypothetical protein